MHKFWDDYLRFSYGIVRHAAFNSFSCFSLFISLLVFHFFPTKFCSSALHDKHVLCRDMTLYYQLESRWGDLWNLEFFVLYSCLIWNGWTFDAFMLHTISQIYNHLTIIISTFWLIYFSKTSLWSLKVKKVIKPNDKSERWYWN